MRTVFPSFFFSFPFFLFFFSKNAGFFFQVARGAIIGFSARVFQADATIRPAIFFKDLLKNISEIHLEGKLTGKAQTVCLELQSWIKLLRKLHSWGAFFLNFVADRFFPPPLPLEAMLLGLLKKAGSLSISRKQLWIGGGGILYAKPLIWKQFCCVR